MKMKYLQDRQIFSNQRRSNNSYSYNRFLIWLIIIAVICWLVFSFLPGIWINIFFTLARAGNYLEDKVYSSVSLIIPSRLLVEENQRLNQELSLTIIENERMKTIISDLQDQEIISQLNNPDILALGRIIFSSEHYLADFFLVEMTEDYKKEDLINTEARIGNFLAVGQVIDQKDGYLKIENYSSPRLSLEVLVGERRDPAKAFGQGGGYWKITLPKGREYLRGEPVYLLKNSEILLLGFINEISQKENEPGQDIFVIRPIDLRNWPYLEFYH